MKRFAFLPAVALSLAACQDATQPTALEIADATAKHTAFGPTVATYSNDFEGAVGSEWSSTSVGVTPLGARRFLGEFGSETVSLTIPTGPEGLPAHTEVTVEFDLFIIRSWDGNGVFCCGPDEWDLSVAGGPTLLHTTFGNIEVANVDRDQAYPGTFPGASHPLRTGAAEENTLGFVFANVLDLDAVYNLSFTFEHAASSLTLNFSAQRLQGIDDESWGIDNVVVHVDRTANQSPTAAAGPAQTVEWASGGVSLTLDGSGSSDPDEDELTYSWSEDGNEIGTGEAPTVNLSLGTHTITLTVDDGNGETDTDEVVIHVVDRTAPTVTASLVPVRGRSLKSDKGLFTVEFSCSDACDSDPVVTSATLNDIAVENGQVVDLRVKSGKLGRSGRRGRSAKSSRSERSGRSGRDEPLRIEGRAFTLEVVCVDASGNEGSASATPEFAQKSTRSEKSDKNRRWWRG